MKIHLKHFRVQEGEKVDLKERSTVVDPFYKSKDDYATQLANHVERLSALQQMHYAESKHAVLLIFQAMDAAGKDGTIRRVMSGLNPQGVVVHSFKAPSAEELDHDFLWRCARRLPARGQIGIFNRSHYEEVLVVRVHPQLLEPQRLPPRASREDVWERRYREINSWERYLGDSGFRLVKLFLNISREEQRKRFLTRIDLPEKNWKFSASDGTSGRTGTSTSTPTRRCSRTPAPNGLPGT